MPTPERTVERAEELADRVLPDRTRKLAMLAIVNPYATTVSERLKDLVVSALRSRYQVEAVETEARGHAIELAREAAGRYDVVLAFGGDGTVNEAANGVIGSSTPLTALPGGLTNVFCRALGIPADVVDAAEHLLALADNFRPRRVDAGRMNGRHFVFASGAGLDATVVERLEQRTGAKGRPSEWYYAYAAVSSFARSYLTRPPRVRVEVPGSSVEAVTVIVQNTDPLTFFGRRPLRVCEGAGLDTGSISLAVLKKATPLAIPTLIPRLFTGSAAAVQRHRQVTGFPRVREARVVSADDRPFPVQVDGDYLGRCHEVVYEVDPGALCVVG